MHYFLQHIISKYIFQLSFANIPKKKAYVCKHLGKFSRCQTKKTWKSIPPDQDHFNSEILWNKKRQTVRRAFLNIVNSFQSFLKIVNKTCHDACCGRISPHFNLFKCRCSLTSIFCVCEHIALIGLHFITNH